MKCRTDLADENENFSESKVTLRKNFGEIELLGIKGDKCKSFIINFKSDTLILNSENFKSACIFALNLLKPEFFSKILVCGLGNPDITSDSLGIKTAEKIFVTAHMKKESAENNIKEISSFTPDVAGKTGIESFELIKSAAKLAKADLIIAIDSLCTSNPKRLCSTLQFTDGGIAAGSGIKKHTQKLDKENLNIPVIAVGMPTVIDIGKLTEKSIDLTVTPLNIDILIKKPAKYLAAAINGFLTDGLFSLPAE